MTGRAKKCCIFFIASTWLLLCRILLANLDLADNYSDWLFVLLAQVIGMGVIPLTLYKFWVKEDVLTGLSIKPEKKIPLAAWGLTIIAAFLTAFVTRGVSIVWQTVIRMFGYTHVNSVGTIYSDVGVLLMDILATAILPALFEELTDRGLLSSALGGMDDRVKVVLIAIFFGLAHQNIVQTGYTFAAGLVFAYLLVTTKSIFPGVIVHFVNNFLSVLSNYSEQNNGWYGKLVDLYYAFVNKFFFLAFLIWVAAGVALFFLLRYLGSVMKKENRSDPVPTASENVAESAQAGAWYEYAFLYGAGTMMLLTTAFTMIWGIWR